MYEQAQRPHRMIDMYEQAQRLHRMIDSAGCTEECPTCHYIDGYFKSIRWQVREELNFPDTRLSAISEGLDKLERILAEPEPKINVAMAFVKAAQADLRAIREGRKADTDAR